MPDDRTFTDESVFDTLRALRRGVFLAELAGELAALVDAVRHARKAGKLTITIGIRPATKADADTLILDDTITVKAPALDRGGTILFPLADGGLSRRDPRQPELEGIREAPAAPIPTPAAVGLPMAAADVREPPAVVTWPRAASGGGE